MFGLEAPVAAALLSGVLQGGSSLLGGMFGASGQAAANAQQQTFNATQAAINRDWQQYMSNTAYQRAMADMQQAGLNPILAANLGGASTPGGSTATISPGNAGAFLQQGISSAGEAVSRAAQTKAVLNQAQKDESQVDLNNAATSYTKSNEVLNTALQDKARQDTATSAAQAHNAMASARAHDAAAALSGASAANEITRNAILQHDIHSAKARSEIEKERAFNAQKFGQGHYADTAASVTRQVKTAGEGAWSGYQEYVGKPFQRGVDWVIDQFRGGSQPAPRR